MIEPTPRAADLEAGLAEIDRRLRQIQDELAGAEPTSPSPETPAPKRHGRSGPLASVLQKAARDSQGGKDRAHGDQTDTGDNARPLDEARAVDDARRVDEARAQLDDLERQLFALADLRDKLLASIRELVDGYQAAAHAQPGTSRPPEAAQDEPVELTVSAGPFASLEAVRAFERAVASLPGVRETTVRGYEGADRAIVDVRLAGTEYANTAAAPKS